MTAQTAKHSHYYDGAANEWLCRECETVTDYCTRADEPLQSGTEVCVEETYTAFVVLDKGNGEVLVQSKHDRDADAGHWTYVNRQDCHAV